MKKLTYKEVKEFIESKGYILISEEYKRNDIKLILKDKCEYYYYVTFDVFKQNNNPNKFDKSNSYTIQNIKLWCKLNNKPFELLDNQEYKGNKKKLKWKCLKPECREIFKSSWVQVQAGKGCGMCDGRQVGSSNCLATTNPNLASQWHPTLNGELTPYDFVAGAREEVWWLCDKGHEWKVNIYIRNQGNGCPYCSHQFPSKDYNLLVCNPELCEEWDYEKNDKRPEECLPGKNEKVWWKCKKCGWEWKAWIYSRSAGIGCPQCCNPKGEKRSKKYLDNNHFIEIKQDKYNKLNIIDKNSNKYYMVQKKFDGLLGTGGGLLSYDFYLPNYNLLIEYQGNYHDGSVGKKVQSKKQFEKQVEHDRRKKEYAINNNINLLEIWYYDYDNIEKILDDYFNKEKNINIQAI